MQIIEKDISWLLEKVPDFDMFSSFYEENLVNGFVAGGFLRKMILSGSFQEAIKLDGDIDFFYHSQVDCKNSLKAMYAKRFPRAVVPSYPNSLAGYAFNVDSPKKVQLIYKKTGDVISILNTFDISNCKIATNGKKVWMVEDWEDIEKNRIIRVDNYAGNYLLNRLLKYMKSDYTLYKPNNEKILTRMLEMVQKGEGGKVRTFINSVKYKNLITKEQLLIFHNKLGKIPQSATDDAYEEGSLSMQEDYAVHMYKRVLSKEVDN